MSISDVDLHVLKARIEDSVRRIPLALHGLSVLTEAASGAFLSTAVAAAVGGAERVFACTRDSQWGTAKDIEGTTLALAGQLGVADRIEVTTQDPARFAENADIVTNLGFVRPISRTLVEQLPIHAAVSLMWEPWELRHGDIDLKACEDRGIAIIATNESHPDIATLKSVGLLALKLLLDCRFEVLGLKVLVVGSNPFGHACCETISSVGADVKQIDPTKSWESSDVVDALKTTDAVVVVEHRYKAELFGCEQRECLDILRARRLPFVHICGGIDDDLLKAYGVTKTPARSVPLGFMTVTTSYLGCKPVVDLHVAGLHVGSIVARQRMQGASVAQAIEAAVSSGYGLGLLE